VMSRSKKRVTLGYSSSDLILPKGTQRIVRVSDLRGGNVCEVEYPSGEKVLSLIPSKFKNAVWIRKGAGAIVEEPADQEYAGKVRTTIVHLLSAAHVKELKKINKWPEEFLTEGERKQLASVADDNEGEGFGSGRDSDNDDDLFVNPNHIVDSDEEGYGEDEDD